MRTLLFGVAALALAVVACSGPEAEQAAAREALSTWQAKQPPAYTFIATPTGTHSGNEALIRVENERVTSVIDRQAGSHEYDDYTMTQVLEEAVDTSEQRENYVGAYDRDFGFLRWFDVPSERPVGDGSAGYGLTIRCFEPSVAESACMAYF